MSEQLSIVKKGIVKRGLERPLLNGKVNFPLFMAPMVGLSHTSFRRLVLHYMPAEACTLWPTEMLNSRRIPSEKVGLTPETYRHPDDKGMLVPQILGNEEEAIRKCIEKLESWGIAGIDINMGCPVTKALKHNYGVALMGDPDYAAEVVKMVVRYSHVPVSVKLRAVESGQLEELKIIVSGILDAGASWLTFHPRRGSQKRRGEADWSQIAWLRKQTQCPILGNGDVQTVEDIDLMLDETCCDGVVVGRALTARPWLFWQWGEKWGWSNPPGQIHKKAPQTPSEEAKEYGRSLQLLLNFMKDDFKSETLALRKFHFYIKTGSVWLDFGQELTGLVHQAKSVSELSLTLEDFFKQDLKMYPRTYLRQ